MKQTIMAIFLTIGLTNISLAGNVYTGDCIKTLLKKKCKCETVCLLDLVYEDYPLSRALTKADCTNYKYKSHLFDCDDVAFSVKTLVVDHISEITDSGGAVMFGIAFTENKAEKDSEHIVNIAVYKKDIYIYDWQEPTDKNTIEIKKYLKTNIIHLIIM